MLFSMQMLLGIVLVVGEMSICSKLYHGGDSYKTESAGDAANIVITQ